MRLITIDPGTTTGWAYFVNGVLKDCGYASSDKCIRDPPWAKYLDGAVVVVEMPVLYKSEDEKNPNSILRNGICGARYMGRADAFALEVLELSPPRKWKGTIGKPPKGKQYLIERRLRPNLLLKETKLIESTKSARDKGPYLNHNVVDAVAMGLWWLQYKGIRVGKIFCKL